MIMVSEQHDRESGRWRVSLTTPGDHVMHSILAVSKERALEQARMLAPLLGLVEKTDSNPSGPVFFEVPP